LSLLKQNKKYKPYLIPLSFHVDYWNKLNYKNMGIWADPYSDEKYVKNILRQLLTLFLKYFILIWLKHNLNLIILSKIILSFCISVLKEIHRIGKA